MGARLLGVSRSSLSVGQRVLGQGRMQVLGGGVCGGYAKGKGIRGAQISTHLQKRY